MGDLVDHEESVADLTRWRDLIRERFVALDIHPGNTPAMRGRVEMRTVGQLAVASVQSVGQVFRRTARLIDRYGEEHLQVGLLRAGEACLEQDGRTARLRPGCFVVYDTTRPFTWSMAGAWSMNVYTWPRHTVPLSSTGAPTLTARPAGAGASGIVACAALSQLATVTRSVGGTEGVQLAARVAELVLTAVAHETPSTPEAPAPVHLRDVLELIELRLDDPDLAPAVIARDCHLSLRSLHRLFADQPRSLAGWIRFRRLERARAELAAAPHLPIAVVAARHCFSDGTVFARAFRAEYGLSPRDVRHTGQVPAMAPTVGRLARSAQPRR